MLLQVQCVDNVWLAFCQPKAVDVEQLVGNVEEVSEVSQKLLTKLEEATHGKDFNQQIIGKTWYNFNSISFLTYSVSSIFSFGDFYNLKKTVS